MGVQRHKRPQSAPSYGVTDIAHSTEADTAASGAGLLSMRSTSTGGPVVYGLAALPEPGGQMLAVHASLVGATSVGAGFHLNAAAGSFFGSSSEDMITMLGQGSGCLLMPITSDRWAMVGANGATLSTST